MRNLAIRLVTKYGIPQEQISYFYAKWSRLCNALKHGDPYWIRNVTIETTTECNRRCKYCPVSLKQQPKNLMSEEMFLHVMKELQSIKFKGVLDYAFYNEPLLDPRLLKLVATGKKMLPRATHRLYTNGDYLTLPLAQELCLAGIDYFVLTDHSNLESRRELFEQMNLDPVVAGRIHYQMGKDLSLYNRGGLLPIEQTGPSRFWAWLTKHMLGGCSIVTIAMIGWDGKMYLCCMDAFKKHEVGDLQKNTLREILREKHYRKLRKDISLGKYDLPICKACKTVGSCSNLERDASEIGGDIQRGDV